MAVSMGEAAKVVVFERLRRVETSFRVAGVAHPDIPTFFMTRRKSFCVAGAILSRRFQKLTCIFRGRRNTLEVSIVVLCGRRSTLDVSCCVFFANRIFRAASRSEDVQIVWQARYFLTCVVETRLSMGEAAKVMMFWSVETSVSMREAAKVMMFWSGDRSSWHIVNYVFTFLFLLELAIRLAAQGMGFFCSEETWCEVK
eukprot:s1620_g1.t1